MFYLFVCNIYISIQKWLKLTESTDCLIEQSGQMDQTEQLDQSEPLLSDKMKSNKSKSNQLKSNQIKSNQIKSNQINSNQLKSNKSKHPFIGFERIEVVKPLD